MYRTSMFSEFVVITKQIQFQTVAYFKTTTEHHTGLGEETDGIFVVKHEAPLKDLSARKPLVSASC